MLPRFIIGLVLVTVLSFDLTYGCSCVSKTILQEACDAGFVIKAKVKDVKRTKVPGSDGLRSVYPQEYTTYTFELKETFKAKPGVSAVLNQRPLQMVIEPYEMCAPSFTKGDTYLITGYTANGKMRLSGCNFHQVYDNLSKDIKEGFKTKYYTKCGTPEARNIYVPPPLPVLRN